MTNEQYFTLNSCSNSSLTALKNKMYPSLDLDLSDAFEFGSLVDAMITERHRCDFWAQTLDGKEQKFWNDAMKCLRSFESHYLAPKFIANCEFQKISQKKRQLSYNGIDFEIDCRCKWDFFGPVSGDIKTTAATSQKQFKDSCLRLDYYRARAWYMDLEDRDTDLIIGISKINQEIFFVSIERDDENYNLGRAQYEELAFYWWLIN